MALPPPSPTASLSFLFPDPLAWDARKPPLQPQPSWCTFDRPLSTQAGHLVLMACTRELWQQPWSRLEHQILWASEQIRSNIRYRGLHDPGHIDDPRLNSLNSLWVLYSPELEFYWLDLYRGDDDRPHARYALFPSLFPAEVPAGSLEALLLVLGEDVSPVPRLFATRFWDKGGV